MILIYVLAFYVQAQLGIIRKLGCEFFLKLQLHTGSSDVLIWVENVLKNRTTFLKLKMFSFET